jgi:cytochrome P450
VLRIKSSIRGLFRTTTREVRLGGATLPKGATIWLVWGAADHDESVFPQPDVFDPRRPNLADHLSFGKGTHFCIGAPLARVELRIALELLTSRLPDLRLVEGQELIYPASPVSQGVDRLELEWRVPAAAGTASQPDLERTGLVSVLDALEQCQGDPNHGC